MKIGCKCGELIFDQTDSLPHKAHLVPDVDWFAAIESAEGIITDLADGKISKKDALSLIHNPFYHFSRLMWQCKHCGRIFIDDPRDGRDLSVYASETATEDRETLRHSSRIKTAIDEKKRANQALVPTPASVTPAADAPVAPAAAAAHL